MASALRNVDKLTVLNRQEVSCACHVAVLCQTARVEGEWKKMFGSELSVCVYMCACVAFHHQFSSNSLNR